MKRLITLAPDGVHWLVLNAREYEQLLAFCRTPTDKIVWAWGAQSYWLHARGAISLQ